MSRPEGTVPPELFYNDTEAKKYSVSTRMINIQTEITQRALDMLRLPEGKPSYILDIGCGSGLSGNVLQENGHYWVGCDISQAMLHEAVVDGTESGDFVHSDMGLGLPFRPASFDGVISISAIQWLCYADTNEQIPKARLNRFFSSLYAVLKVGGTAVLQFYPENAEQAVLISQIASKVGFTGGVVVDYPNSTKAKKYYLCLSFERTYTVPTALSTTGHAVGNADSVTVIGSSKKGGSAAGYSRKDKKPRGTKNRREWITAQKEHRKRQGKEARENTKYTGRKRATPF